MYNKNQYKKKLFQILSSAGIISICTFGMSLNASANDPSEYTEPYVVHQGDSLSSIARELCNDERNWVTIYDLNRDILQNPDLIHPNDCLLIPVSEENNISEANESITEKWTQEDWECLGKMTIEERKIYLSYLKHEPEISTQMQDIVEGLGGYLEGFESRCKTPHSLYEKMYLRPDKKSIDEIEDILRYTEIIPEEKYTSGTKDTFQVFLDRGWVPVWYWNAWIDTAVAYKGINTEMRNTDSMNVEIQFHTTKSFEIKNSEEDHSLYEQRRLLEEGSDEYNAILEKQFKLYSVVQVPEGVETLTEGFWEQADAAMAG